MIFKITHKNVATRAVHFHFGNIHKRSALRNHKNKDII